MWMLRALADTPLTIITVVFLLAGHTRNKLDRLFSRISVALRGKDYFTVDGMLRRVRETLRHTVLYSSHLGQVWQWKILTEGDVPGGGASDAQPCPGTCLPVFEGQRGLDAVEAVDGRRGIVNASTGIVRAGGRVCGALAPGRA